MSILVVFVQITKFAGEQCIMGATPRRKSAGRSTTSPDKTVPQSPEQIPNGPTLCNGTSLIALDREKGTVAAGLEPRSSGGRVVQPRPPVAVISNRSVSLKPIAGRLIGIVF